jgi:hypothetical protein
LLSSGWTIKIGVFIQMDDKIDVSSGWAITNLGENFIFPEIVTHP